MIEGPTMPVVERRCGSAGWQRTATGAIVWCDAGHPIAVGAGLIREGRAAVRCAGCGWVAVVVLRGWPPNEPRLDP